MLDFMMGDFAMLTGSKLKGAPLVRDGVKYADVAVIGGESSRSGESILTGDEGCIVGEFRRGD